MQYTLAVEDVLVPVRLKKSKANRVRYSITRTCANLTVPAYFFNGKISAEKEKFEMWCRQQFNADPKLLNRFKAKQYCDGDTLHVMGESFTISIQHDSSSAFAKIETGNRIIVSFPEEITRNENAVSLSALMAKLMANHFKDYIDNKVHTINARYFNESINAIRIKNNSSNWGSCSKKRNVNLSVRLLLAPEQVLDYVIVHELSHLKEMNHSPRFWKIVSSIMPEYKKYELWLKNNGHMLRF